MFISLFQKELFRLLGIKLAYSTAYHPQSDGQIERLNQYLENYLRCMTHHQPSSWVKWLPLAEWWYNSSYHSSLKITSFETLYGRSSSVIPALGEEVTVVKAISDLLQDRQNMLSFLKETYFKNNKEWSSKQIKRGWTRAFMWGDWIYLRLQPYKQTSLAIKKSLKLAAKFYGPFKIVAKSRGGGIQAAVTNRMYNPLCVSCVTFEEEIETRNHSNPTASHSNRRFCHL